jgi:hypothetical protein
MSRLFKNIKLIKLLPIAKAMFIGYKIDLDKDLVLAYSTVGVIHLIVIAG